MVPLNPVKSLPSWIIGSSYGLVDILGHPRIGNLDGFALVTMPSTLRFGAFLPQP